MTIDWKNIRTLNNSQNSAFEELVCQLARDEESPDRIAFTKVGAPDGGVEAYATQRNGDEFGWQAKYFTSMGSSQWSQLAESFKTALATHPRLTKYYICIPLDRQDPRQMDKSWFMDKWNQHTAAWTEYASKEGRTIEFEYWGSSELLHRLSQEKHAGRTFFWFQKEEFTDAWFQEHLAYAIDSLGPRYSPELNVELDISKCFDSLARGDEFRGNIRNAFHPLFRDVYKAMSRLPDSADFNGERETIGDALARMKEHFDDAQRRELSVIDVEGIGRIWKELYDSIQRCQSFSKTLDSRINDGAGAIYEFGDYLQSPAMSLANLPAMLLIGDAGMGKSHLLADVAARRQKSGKASVLLLGQHFISEESPWTQIQKNLLRFKCTESEFLGALNAKAEAQGERLLFIVDAINEGTGRRFWPEHIKGFINSFTKYPWLSLVLSIRSSYVSLIAPSELVPDGVATRVHHYGFDNVEHEAASRFFFVYGIEQPSVPALHPEFSNPLFLKIFCEGLKRSGLSRIPKGYAGISSIIDFFLRSIDAKLGGPTQFDYPPEGQVAQKVIAALIEYKLNSDSSFIPYDDAFSIADKVVSQFSNKRRFLDALISEGLLSQNLYRVAKDKLVEGVYIAYERFEDHLTANYLLDKHLTPDSAISAFESGQPLATYIQAGFYRQGILEAFSVQLPERIDRELFEVVEETRRGDQPIAEAFLRSLIWRKPGSIQEKTKDYVNQHIVPYPEGFDLFLQIVYSIAADPEHLYNADTLHKSLVDKSLAERDAEWTIYLEDQNYTGSAIRKLIDWAGAPEGKKYLSSESRLLACKSLTWLFTSTNNFLRDAATQALATLLVDNLDVALETLLQFETVNDPYVYERLLGGIYGAALRSEKLDPLEALSSYLVTNFFGAEQVYPNVLVRDYARNIVEFALYKDVYKMVDPATIRPPYKSDFPKKFLTNEELDTAYAFDYQSSDFKQYQWSQNAILSSMVTEYGRGISSYGDFGRYTFQSAFSDWPDLNPQHLSNYACQLIFDVYGYDVQALGEFDRNVRSNSRRRGRSERIGKKYQWIALYEVLARVADNHKMLDETTRWGEKKQYVWYQGPWHPFVRNIDPSVGHIPIPDISAAWWAGNISYADWEGKGGDWVVRDNPLPDPKSMIEVADPTGVEWLILQADPSWDESVPLGYELYEYPHKHLWYQIRSYFVRDDKADELIGWASQQHFMGRWFPEGGEQYRIFTREYYWSPAYRYFDNPYYGRSHWEEVEEQQAPHRVMGEVMATTEGHRWESGAESENRPNYLAPREFMFASMALQPSKKIGQWLNQKGELICWDPSVEKGGPSVLAVRKDALLDFLAANSIKIFWTVLGEKQIVGDTFGRAAAREEVAKWLELSGVFTYVDDQLIGKVNPIFKTPQ